MRWQLTMLFWIYALAIFERLSSPLPPPSLHRKYPSILDPLKILHIVKIICITARLLSQVKHLRIINGALKIYLKVKPMVTRTSHWNLKLKNAVRNKINHKNGAATRVIQKNRTCLFEELFYQFMFIIHTIVVSYYLITL